MAESKDDQTDKAHYDPQWISWNGGFLHSNNGGFQALLGSDGLTLYSPLLLCNLSIFRSSIW